MDLPPFVVNNISVGLISENKTYIWKIYGSHLSDTETSHKKKTECSCKSLQNHGSFSEAVPVSVRVTELGPQ